MSFWQRLLTGTLIATVNSVAGASMVGEARQPAFDIPRIADVTVDGDASDWEDEGFCIEALRWTVPLAPPPWGPLPSTDDFLPRFRLGTDDAGFLLLATVRDDVPHSPEDFVPFFWFYKGDSIVAYLSVGEGEEKRDCRLFVGVGDGPDLTPAKVELAIAGKALVAGDKTPVAEGAVRRTDEGYTIEARIPWAALGAKHAAGDTLRFQLLSVDGDGAADEPFYGELFSSGGMAREGVRLAESASEPVTASASMLTKEYQAPVVVVVATSDQAGAGVRVLRGEELLAESSLELRAGRSATELVLPKQEGVKTGSELSVSVADRRIAGLKEDLPSTEVGDLAVRLSTPEGVSGAILVRVAMGERAVPFPGIEARVTVLDWSGNEVQTTRCPVGAEGTTVTVPEGIYRVKAHIDDLRGWRLEGNGFIAVGTAGRKHLWDIVALGRQAVADPHNADYAGWLAYITEDIAAYLEDPTAHDPMKNAVQRADHLTRWLRTIRDDPDALAKLRGQQEWAYLSRADGTGQPFSIWIPQDYDAATARALSVELHGASGTHFAVGPRLIGGFQLTVMGRNPWGGYRALAEIDVLEAIDYVRTHWNIDPDRIHIGGPSMGGGGTFRLATRFPDLFASARPFCGFGMEVFPENALHVPFCSVHSQDDWIVPILYSREPIRILAEAGGQAIQHETNGIGHPVNDWAEGAAYAARWAEPHRRVGQVGRVHYTATDELARGAYWVRVEEWGAEGRPATIDARLGEDNTLYVSLDNVNVARLALADSPARRDEGMRLIVNRHAVCHLPSPLPEALYLSRCEDGWCTSSDKPLRPDQRLHFPGGAAALFHGEPVMVVWGTRGDENLTSHMLEAAWMARKSSSTGWHEVDPHQPPGMLWRETRNTLFGSLPGKPDTDVTEEDMKKYNLLLIGTAEQNALVARIADALPVRVEDGKVLTDDGQSWSFEDRALGLLHYNPLASNRLIYWVGSDVADFYAKDAPLMEIQSWSAAPPDLIVHHATERQLVAARRFDSRWSWEPGYADAPRMSAADCSVTGSSRLWADMLRRETGADFALITTDWQSIGSVYSAGETNLMDLIAVDYGERLALVDLTGEAILMAGERLAAAEEDEVMKKARGEDADSVPRFLPTPTTATLQTDRSYRVVVLPRTMWSYVQAMQTNPPSFRLSRPEAIRRAIKQMRFRP